MPAIEVDNLVREFGDVTAVEGVTFQDARFLVHSI